MIYMHVYNCMCFYSVCAMHGSRFFCLSSDLCFIIVAFLSLYMQWLKFDDDVVSTVSVSLCSGV